MMVGAMAHPPTDDLARWAASGAMALTGRPHRAPLGPPSGLVPAVAELEARLGAHGVEVDGLALLGERAALLGLTRAGSASCGGGARLLAAQGGWLAVSLARPDDLDLLPAWLGVTAPAEEVAAGRAEAGTWRAVAQAVAPAGVDQVLAAGVELGLPVARLGEVAAGAPAVRVAATGPARLPRPVRGARVVDLSSLWAGPLCASLLGRAGADVVQVEDRRRPDGARRGDPRFYDLLHAGHRSVALDLGRPDDRAHLHRLLAAADVVVEGSRPRALRQLGVDAEALVAGGGPAVWVAITGHGRAGDGAGRVGFGDDAAVAGGLVVADGDGPCFCADAVGDPLTGLTAAVAVLDALAGPRHVLIDVALARVAAAAAGPTLDATGVPAAAVAPPRARPVAGRAPALGAHTAEVLGR